MRAGQRSGDVRDVEEEESRLGGVRLDGFGGELRGLDLVSFLLADRALHFLVGDGKGQRRGRMGVGLGIGEAAEDIVGRSGSELGAVGCRECDVHVRDGDGLATIVGDDEEDGQESVFAEVDGEQFRLVGGVVGVGGDGDLLVRVVVVRGIAFGGLGRGLDEVFRGEEQRERGDGAADGQHTGKPRLQHRLHESDYREGFRTLPGVCLEWLNLISSLYSLLYSVVLTVGMLASLPYWLFQMARHGKYRKGLAERLGRVPSRLQLPVKPEPAIWVHAVSVGEVLAVAGLVAELRRRLPRHRIFISTTTDTGQALARQRFGEANVLYFPMDFKFAIRPYLRAMRPQMVVIAETEFWPNFMRLAHGSGARIVVVNARISDRSWPSYRRFRGLLRRLLAHVDLFLAQTQEDAARLQDIGARPERVRVVGNLKFDIAAPDRPTIVDRVRESIAASGTGPLLVCGSTVDGEEPLLLKAFENLLVQHSKAAMILAPRHPERFSVVAALLEQMSVRFWRRSEWDGEALTGGVFLLDTIGELAALYALADVAFVGGSLVPRGGHNIVEPAQYGVAIVVGNHTENFRDIVSLFQSRNAVRIVGPAELPLVLLELLANDAERKALGQRAAETMRSQIGATSRTADEIEELLARP